MSATAPSVPVPRSRLATIGGWLLTLSPLYFVAVILVNVGSLVQHGIGLFDDITRAQMDALGFSWVLINTVFPLAIIAGTVGVIVVATAVRRAAPVAAVWTWLSTAAGIVCLLGMIPYPVFRILAGGFTEDRLGDNLWYTFWDAPSLIASHFGVAALVLLCVALFVARIRRTAALVIGGLTVVYFIAGLLGAPLPPFVISFLWLALGIAWLTGRVRA